MFARALIIICLLTFIVPHAADANRGNKRHILNPDASYDPPFQPILLSTSILIDGDDKPPTEPNFADIDYKKNTPFNSIEDRINRLSHGVTKSIPPEFDHFGHEIRKYMSDVGNMKVFEDEEFLKKQIKSVKKARVIFDYWEDYLNNEVKGIDDVLATETVTSSARTKLKQNKAQLKTFVVVLKSWIDANERFLTFIFENPDILEVQYPELVVSEARYKVDLYNLLAFKQQKLKELQSFGPFEMMVY